MGNVPRGIEVLVKKASVDPAFRALLLDRRSAAAKEIGLELTQAEEAMIDQIPTAQLESIINGATVEPVHRSTFMGCAGGLMLAALVGVIVVGPAFSSLGNRPSLHPPALTQPAESGRGATTKPSSTEGHSSSATIPSEDQP